MRQLATIQKIADVLPIEGADTIEKVKIKEWWCVAKKGEFKVGDMCVYFEIDSLLPVSNPSFEFLAKGNKTKKMNIEGVEYVGYRLRTIKLRGQISQGLALPLSMLAVAVGDENLAEGDDLSGRLSVVKYEPPVPAELSGKIRGNFPPFIPKTDEERVQNLAGIVEKHRGDMFYVTEKLDGTSATFYKKDGVLGVCSRNLDLLETEGNTHWRIARELKLEEILPDGFSIQGEIIGHGIQQNPLNGVGQKFFAFNVYNIDANKYLDFRDFEFFCKKIGIEIVPIVEREFILDGDVTTLLKLAEGYSMLNPQCLREGLVFRPHIEQVEDIGTNGKMRLSFKAISNQYLLNEK